MGPAFGPEQALSAPFPVRTGFIASIGIDNGFVTDLRKAQGPRPEAAAAGRVGLVLHLHFALVLVKLPAYS